MTDAPDQAPILLAHDQAASLARLLRELEQFLDECDESVDGALATHFGLDPASEAFSAALCFHADKIEAALAGDPEHHGHLRDTSLQLRADPNASRVGKGDFSPEDCDDYLARRLSRDGQPLIGSEIRQVITGRLPWLRR
ncbi:hypothetical protein [Streptomyces sp. CC210A]|uniref:hypothetical protein n=1 Tax=Streptomyces sp. CC210A TaxID=2898184 RepID=UPI001F157EC1|nr:hypothetical protein [Streptomyces sp. CC210A]